jgi:hypothetical protein
MDILLSMLVGLGGGLAMSMLMPDIRGGGASAAAWRRVVLAMAGIAGGVAGVGASMLVMPASRGDGLVMSLAAVAGALWLSWLAAVVVSRRRAEDADGPSPTAPAGTVRDMPAYDAARHALVEHLLDDAIAHEAGLYGNVGRELTIVEEAMPRSGGREREKLYIALAFWHSWIAARDRRWQRNLGPSLVARDEWPGLARRVVSDLAADREISDERLLAQFAYAAPELSRHAAPVPAAI